MKTYKRIVVLLGLLLFFFNAKIASLFHEQNTLEWFNFKDGLNSLNFLVFSILLFWSAKKYHKVLMRWFMVFCAIDFISKTKYSISDWSLLDNTIIMQIIFFAIVELYITASKKQKID